MSRASSVLVPSSYRPRRSHHRYTREMRPGRFELPRSKRTTRPSTLRAGCPSFPIATETSLPSRTMDDLDLADSAFVVTLLSRAEIRLGRHCQALWGPPDHTLARERSCCTSRHAARPRRLDRAAFRAQQQSASRVSRPSGVARRSGLCRSTRESMPKTKSRYADHRSDEGSHEDGELCLLARGFVLERED